ncbi:MAG: hypothetical protein ACXWP0_01255 [Ktedonobacterales bacterium]
MDTDWFDLTLTEEGGNETGVDFHESGAVSISQDNTPDDCETQRIDLSKRQARKLIAGYIHLFGLVDPDPD